LNLAIFKRYSEASASLQTKDSSLFACSQMSLLVVELVGGLIADLSLNNAGELFI